MTGETPVQYPDLWIKDREKQNDAYKFLMEATEKPVPWAGAVRDDVVKHLRDADNHNRAIAAQLLCDLASTDGTGRVLGGDLDALITITKDPKFVTARHSLKSLWKIGLAGEEPRHALLGVIAQRYRDSFAEKNGTLVRSDLAETLRQLHDATSGPAVESIARELIATEPDGKYRKKYLTFGK